MGNASSASVADAAAAGPLPPADLADPARTAAAAADYASRVTPFTPDDRAWLASAQHAKVLDPLARVIGVGARDPATDRPRVLVLYPLRVAHDPARAADRGFSTRKWNSRAGAAPVPWPNTFWLCCPKLVRAVGALEHSSDPTPMRRFQERLVAGEDARAKADAATFAEQHRNYAAFRWSLLPSEDRASAIREGYEPALRTAGIGGLRHATQVKCLHVHYAHFLASGGDNVVGEWVHEELERRRRAKTSDDDEGEEAPREDEHPPPERPNGDTPP